jgi:hypothetical protein
MREREGWVGRGDGPRRDAGAGRGQESELAGARRWLPAVACFFSLTRATTHVAVLTGQGLVRVGSDDFWRLGACEGRATAGLGQGVRGVVAASKKKRRVPSPRPARSPPPRSLTTSHTKKQAPMMSLPPLARARPAGALASHPPHHGRPAPGLPPPCTRRAQPSSPSTRPCAHSDGDARPAEGRDGTAPAAASGANGVGRECGGGACACGRVVGGLGRGVPARPRAPLL